MIRHAHQHGQAFQELAKGEQTASALENHLTALEAKIEALLAQADQQQSSQSTTTSSTTPSSTDEPKP